MTKIPSIWFAVLAIVIVASLLRLWGLGSLEFWLDEAMWAGRTASGSFGMIRPIGYTALSWFLAQIKNSEFTFRLPSFVFGVAQVPLIFLVGQRLYRSSVYSLLSAVVLAIHPISVAMSKEFKPYALEATIHTWLLLLMLEWWRNKDGKVLRLILWTCLISPFFSWSILFTFPGVFLLLGFSLYPERKLNDFRSVTRFFSATCGVVGVLFLARVLGKKWSAGYWGAKYDVFYVGADGLLGRLEWIILKTIEVARFPASLEPSLLPHEAIVTLVPVLAFVGLIFLVRTREKRPAAFLLLMPLLVTCIMNSVGHWPYGLFRTNLFLVSYGILIAVFGLESLEILIFSKIRFLKAQSALIVSVLAGLMIFPLDFRAFARKGPGTLTGDSATVQALDIIVNQLTHPLAAAGRLASHSSPMALPLVLMDSHACGILKYYRVHHGEAKTWIGPVLEQKIKLDCGSFAIRDWLNKVDEQANSFDWIVTNKRGFSEPTLELASKLCPRGRSRILGEETLLFSCNR